VAQFDATRRTLPGLDMYGKAGESPCASAPYTGGAWLSSARVVRCWVKSRNERNPCPMLPAGNAGDSWETAGAKPEEGGDEVKSACPLRPGLHTRYNGRYKGLQTREGELIPKNRSQFGLQSATRLHEVGVASNRRSARCGEYVPGPCTHRPSHHESRQHPKPVAQPSGREPSKVGLAIGVKS
jgi:hypothetical protein